MPTISSFFEPRDATTSQAFGRVGGGRFLPVSCPAAPVIRHPPQRGPSLPPQRPLGSAPNGRRPSRALAVSPVFLHCVPCRPPLRYASFRFTYAALQEMGDPPRLALATPALAAGWLRGCWLTTTANTKKPRSADPMTTDKARELAQQIETSVTTLAAETDA